MYYQHNYLQEPVCKTPWKDTQPIFIKLSSEGFKFRQHWHRHTNKKIPLDERTRKKILRFLWTFKPNKSFCAYLVPSTIPNAPQKDHTNYTQFPKLGTRGKSGLKAPVTVQVTQGGGRTVWAHIGARRARPRPSFQPCSDGTTGGRQHSRSQASTQGFQKPLPGAALSNSPTAMFWTALSLNIGILLWPTS